MCVCVLAMAVNNAKVAAGCWHSIADFVAKSHLQVIHKHLLLIRPVAQLNSARNYFCLA